MRTTTDPKPWVDRSDGDEYRHAHCAYPEAHGCTYEPREGVTE